MLFQWFLVAPPRRFAAIRRCILRADNDKLVSLAKCVNAAHLCPCKCVRYISHRLYLSLVGNEKWMQALLWLIQHAVSEVCVCVFAWNVLHVFSIFKWARIIRSSNCTPSWFSLYLLYLKCSAKKTYQYMTLPMSRSAKLTSDLAVTFAKPWRDHLSRPKSVHLLK